jgi:DNA-binding MarR family transcriptional regulator
VSETDREDLGALFSRVSHRLIDAEQPLLAAQGLSMWEYIALSHLVGRPAPNQLTLARAMGHDKTRLITLLDGLQERGLISRGPDPADRRSHLVSITSAGRKRHATACAAIRSMESDFLADLDKSERASLLLLLSRLADVR